jgi:hypothetical protein
LCLSALLRRSQAATIVSLVLVFLLIFGTLVVAGISAGGNPYEGPRPYPGEPGFQPPGVPWYVYMSPLSALTDALPGTGDITPGGGIPLISSVMNELMRQIQPGYMGEYAMKMGYSLVYAGPGAGTEEKPAGMAAWPFWARFALNQAVLALAALVIAVVAIAPRKPWHRGRALNK